MQNLQKSLCKVEGNRIPLLHIMDEYVKRILFSEIEFDNIQCIYSELILILSKFWIKR
jgi:hypothetical protein